MIHLDTYLEGFESKLEEIQSGIVYVKSYKKPKIRITRLSEERKFVPIELDIEINEKLVIKDRFDWNLNEENVSVDEFVNELCDSLRLPEINRTRLKSQLIYQLIDYIERNTFAPKPKPREPLKPEEIAEEPAGPEQIEGQMIETLNSQAKPQANSTPSITDIVPITIPTINSQSGTQQSQNRGNVVSQTRENTNQPDEEQKKTARQRKLDELKRTTPSSMQTNSKIQFLRDRRSCKNCNHMNPAQSFECKKCKVAFYIMDMLDMSNWKVAQAVQYYQMVVSYFPLLADYVKDYVSFLTGKEFESMYTLKNALITLFSTMKELNEDNISAVKERLEDIFGNFLAGVVIFKQPEVQPSKRRGRKPKAWYEEQDRLRKEKRSRGEAVSSESEEEDSGDDFEMPGISTSVRPKKQKQSVNKDGNGDNEGDEDDEDNMNSDSSAIESRKYKGRPKNKNYTGKKRGRKSKSELLAMQQEKEKMDKEDKVSEQQGSKAEIEGEDGIVEEGAEKEELEDQSKVTDESVKIGEVVAKKRGRPPKIRPILSSSEQQIAKSGSGLKRGRKPKSYYEEKERMELERQQNGGEGEDGKEQGENGKEEGEDGKEEGEEKEEVIKKPAKKVNSSGIPAKRGRPRKIRENEVIADDELKEKNIQEMEEEGGQGEMVNEDNNNNQDDEKESRQKQGNEEEIVVKKTRGRKKKVQQEQIIEQGKGQGEEERQSQGDQVIIEKSNDNNNSGEESNQDNKEDEEIDQEKEDYDDGEEDEEEDEQESEESDQVEQIKGKSSKDKKNRQPEAMEEEDSDEVEEENQSQKNEVDEDGEEENDEGDEDEEDQEDDEVDPDENDQDENEEESLGVRTRRSQVQKTKAISKQPLARTNVNLRRTRKH